MFLFTIKMQLYALLIVSVLSLACGQDRKIKSILNPGCKNCTQENTLVYLRADGSHDTIHQLWDFTRGIPTIIYVIAGLNSSLTITWDGTVPVKYLLSEQPKYSFATAMDKLYEYDDIHDTGHIDPRSPQRSYSLEHMSWRLNNSKLTDKEAMVRVHGHYKEAWKYGIVDVKLDLLPFKDYSAELPHLMHTANSTLVDISLVNLTMARGYNASRFALHFVLVSTDPWNETMHYTMRKSLDDEHTPGVFEIIEIKTPESYSNGDGGYVQFRPVGYTDPKREVSSSTNVHNSNFNRTTLPHHSTLRSFYSNFDENNLLVQDMFVSIGIPGDGYYKQHNFTAWSFTIGYGTPPIESFSLFVVVIICIGLGVPVLLALSGILYVVVRRCKQQRNPPARFTDDE